MKIVVRGFVGGERRSGQALFVERLDLPFEELEAILPALSVAHANMLAKHPRHLVEIEFLDELEPTKRVYRFGTDATLKPGATAVFEVRNEADTDRAMRYWFPELYP